MTLLSHKSSFTLIELLIVIGILAILTAAVVLVLNPSELLKQGRDSTRMTDLASLHKSLQLLLTQNPSISLGTASTVYISVPDTSSTCSNLSLPTLPSGYTYSCVSQASSTLTNGSGWLPIDFSTTIQNLSKLPLDPTNSSSSSLYYAYTPHPTTQTYELTSILESKKYRLGGDQDKTSSDGGNASYLYEKGTNLTLSPLTDTGLVGYWKFDEGSGTQATDSSGNNNIGTLTNGPTWQSAPNCKVGGCLSFDGVNDYVDGGINSILNPTSAITVSSWVNVPSGDSTQYRYIVSDSGTGSNGYELTIASGSPRFEVYNTSPSGYISNSTGNARDSSWHLLTATYSNGSSVLLYIDGMLARSVAATVLLPTNNTSLTIGKRDGNGFYFSGLIDDVRVYNRVFSAAEVLTLYNATK